MKHYTNVSQHRFQALCLETGIKLRTLTSLLKQHCLKEYKILTNITYQYTRHRGAIRRKYLYDLTHVMVGIRAETAPAQGYCLGGAGIIRLCILEDHPKFIETLLHETCHLVNHRAGGENGHSQDWLNICKLVLDYKTIREYTRRYSLELNHSEAA